MFRKLILVVVLFLVLFPVSAQTESLTLYEVEVGQDVSILVSDQWQLVVREDYQSFRDFDLAAIAMSEEVFGVEIKPPFLSQEKVAIAILYDPEAQQGAFAQWGISKISDFAKYSNTDSSKVTLAGLKSTLFGAGYDTEVMVNGRPVGIWSNKDDDLFQAIYLDHPKDLFIEVFVGEWGGYGVGYENRSILTATLLGIHLADELPDLRKVSVVSGVEDVPDWVITIPEDREIYPSTPPEEVVDV